MNELIKVRIFEIINNYHPRDQNVFAHILSMNNSEEELPKYTKESLQYLHRLSITNLKAYSNQRYTQLTLSGIKANKIYLNIVPHLPDIFFLTDALFFWDCQLTNEICINFKWFRFDIRTVQFYGCGLGNKFAVKLNNMLDLRRLHLIRINSDPVGNQGIKQLVRKRMYLLDVLIIENCNITIDVIKLLSKIHIPHLREVKISHQARFIYHLLIKNYPHFKGYSNMRFDDMAIHVPQQGQNDTFIFHAHLSKINLGESIKCHNLQIFNSSSQSLVISKPLQIMKNFIVLKEIYTQY